MVRFTPDLKGTRAGFPIYESGDYEVKVTEVTPIGYMKEVEDKETGMTTHQPVVGGRANLEMVGRVLKDGTLDRTDEGEPVSPVRLYVHSEGAWSITKRFAMAALGYSLEDEEDFNEEVAGDLDLGVEFDPDSDDEEAAVLGPGWARLTGKHLLVSLSKRKWQGVEQQDVAGYVPVRQ